ncbi:MAG: MFS transporter [Christensenellales bacterium]|jgi:Na+/melibiose symporter-like transporter
MNKSADKQTDISQKVPLKEKLFFAAGDIYGGGAGAMITAIYLVFLVNNGLGPALAGIIIMLARIWDAVNDPMMGVISDNTRSKWGRRRPYIFAGGFLLTVAFALLFMPLYGIQSVAVKFALYLFAMLFYNTVSTVILVPYTSLSTEISADYMEKTKVNTIRLIFSMVSSMISGLVPMVLIEALNKKQLTLTAFSLVIIFAFGIFYAVPVILCAVKCKSRVPDPVEKTAFSVKAFLRPLSVKPFLYLVLAFLFSYSCMDIIITNIVYFADFGIDYELDSFIYVVLIMASYAVTVPFYSKLLKNGVSKPVLFRAGIPLYIFGAIFLCLIIPYFRLPEFLIFPACVLIGIGLSGSQMMPWIMFPDVVDAGELQLNERPTGYFSGLMTFIRKSTSAIAIGLSGIILEWTGFIKPETDPLTGLVTNFTQPQSAVWGIRLVIIVPIIIFMSSAYLFSGKIKLTARRSQMISQLLEVRHNLKNLSGNSLSELTNGFLEDNTEERVYSEEKFIAALTTEQKANYQEIKDKVLKIN